MLRPNPKALIIIGGFAVMAGVLFIIAYNQVVLQKEVLDQAMFDTKVMQYDQQIIHRLFPTQAATSAATVQEVRPTITPKPNLTHKQFDICTVLYNTYRTMRLLIWLISLISLFFVKKEIDPHIEKLMSNLSQYELGGIDLNGK